MKGQIPCYVCVASLFSLLFRPIEITPRDQNLRENVAPSKVCMYRKITTLPPPPNWYLFLMCSGKMWNFLLIGWGLSVSCKTGLCIRISLQKQNDFLKANMACISTVISKQVFLAPCKQLSCPGGHQTHVIPLRERWVSKQFSNPIFSTLFLSAWCHQGSQPIAWELSSESTSFQHQQGQS